MRQIDDPPAPVAWTLTGQRVAVAVDASVYPVSVATRAAYRLTDRAYVFIHHVDGELFVLLRPKDAQTDLNDLVGELVNELLDQRIRMDLGEEFRGVHRAIVAEAFAPVRGRLS